MDRPLLVRIGALGFAMFAIAATVVILPRDNPMPVVQATSSDHIVDQTIDLKRTELRRCRDIGEEALRDAACLTLWKENRERFLGSSRASAASSPATSGKER